MREFRKDLPQNRHLLGVTYSADRASAIEKVAIETDVPLFIARSGEDHPGGFGKISEGTVYISVLADPDQDMTPFWDSVDEIDPPKPLPKPYTTASLPPQESWE